MNTYVDEACVKCGTMNLVNLGNMADQTAADVETFKCYSCGTVTKFPELEGDKATLADDQDYADEDGRAVT